MALREVLAQLDVQVRGGDAVRTANADLNRYVASSRAFSGLVGPLRLSLRTIEELRRTQQAGSTIALGYGRAIQQSGRGAATAATDFQRSVASFHEFMSRQPSGGGAAPGLLSSQTLSSVRGGLVELGPALAVVAAGLFAVERAAHAVWSQIREVITEGDQIGDSADRLGISARAYQQWTYIAEQTGTSIEAVSRAFPTLARNMAAGGHGATSASGAFHQLGVSTRTANGALRSQEDVFGDTVVALSRMTNPTQQAALAQRVLGRAGAQLLPLIRQAPGEVDRLRRRFQELGGGLSDDVVDNANQAQQSLADFDVATQSLRSELVGAFIPSVTEAFRGVATFVGTITNAWRESSAGIVVLGGLRVAWAVLGPVIRLLTLPLRLAIGFFVGLFLIVEDFVTYMRGGRSVIGGFLDPLLARVREARAQLGELVGYVQGVAGELGIDIGGAPRGSAAAAPAGPIIPGPRPYAPGGPGGSSGTTIDASTSVVVHGATDPDAVVRAIDRHQRRRTRELADTLPRAADPAVT